MKRHIRITGFTIKIDGDDIETQIGEIAIHTETRFAVIINGQKFTSTEPEQMLVQAFIDKALALDHRPSGEWELRDSDGWRLKPTDRLGWREGQTLYLDPRAGTGA